MATEPSDLPEWATANPTDVVSGQPAIIDPSPSKKASGFTRLERPPRQDHNWLFNLIYKWIEWFKQQVDLNDVHRLGDGLDHSAVNTNNIHRLGNGLDHDEVAFNSNHRFGDGSDHADVATNNAHRLGDGSDHADVVLNTAHRASNGNDHSNVVLNNAHRLGNGADHSDVVLNNAHRVSNGNDHSNVVLNNAHRVSAGSADHSDLGKLTSAIVPASVVYPTTGLFTLIAQESFYRLFGDTAIGVPAIGSILVSGTLSGGPASEIIVNFGPLPTGSLIGLSAPCLITTPGGYEMGYIEGAFSAGDFIVQASRVVAPFTFPNGVITLRASFAGRVA
ncbi:MAG: hypothetical protein HC773_01420 [Scytonema sp. CRU_2_7]|nr:hypothetical protein [Scytonema sp. CRU_2_7]